MQATKLEHDGRNISSGDISTKYYRSKKKNNFKDLQ
jgi:hypothetical protein